MGKVDEHVRNATKPGPLGDLSVTPLPRVIFDLYSSSATGALLLANEDTKKIVYVRSGYPIAIKSNVRAECLGKILVWDGMISREQWRDSLLIMRETGKRQGSVLIEMGVLSSPQLFRGLELQFRFRLCELFSWKRGTHQLWTEVRPPPEMATFDIPPASLIHEGVRSFMSKDTVFGELRPHIELYLVPTENPLWRFQDLQPNAAVGKILRRIDGTTNIDDLLRSSPLSVSETSALLYTLLEIQMVSLSESPQQTWASLKPPRLPAERIPTSPGTTRHGDLARLLERLRRSKPHEILGVNPEASLPNLRVAFQRRAAERHPDRVGASRAKGLRKLAIEALRLTSEAIVALAPDYDADESATPAPAVMESSEPDEAAAQLPLAPDVMLDQPPGPGDDDSGELPLEPDGPLTPDGILAESEDLEAPADDEQTSERGDALDEAEPTSDAVDIQEILVDPDDSIDEESETQDFQDEGLSKPALDLDDTLTPEQTAAQDLAEALALAAEDDGPAQSRPSEGIEIGDVLEQLEMFEPHEAPHAAAGSETSLRAPDATDEIQDPFVQPAEVDEARGRESNPADATLDDPVWRIIEAEQYHQRGLKLLDRGAFAEAARVLEHAVGSFGEEGEFRVSLAWAVFQAGLDDDSAIVALEHLDEAILRSPSPRANLFRGHILRFLDRKDEAVWSYQEALREDPENEVARSELDRILETSSRTKK